MSDRPTWRYVWWNGWNYLAMAWLLVSGVAAALANWVIAHWHFKPYQHQGGVVFAAGLAVFLADSFCRIRDRHSASVSKFFSPDAGGTFLFFLPMWLLAFAFLALGMAIMFGANI
jgi:hypothetical protein